MPVKIPKKGVPFKVNTTGTIFDIEDEGDGELLYSVRIDSLDELVWLNEEEMMSLLDPSIKVKKLEDEIKAKYAELTALKATLTEGGDNEEQES